MRGTVVEFLRELSMVVKWDTGMDHPLLTGKGEQGTKGIPRPPKGALW